MDVDVTMMVVMPIAIMLALYSFSKPARSSSVRDISLVQPGYVSDEEFLAAIPNTSPEIALRVRKIISDNGL